MPKNSNLIRRGAVYYALITVPTDLQSAMNGKKQIWRTLGTKEYAEAKRRLTPELDQWTATFDDLRRRRELTEGDISLAVWDHYSAALDAGDKERLSRPTAADIDMAVDKAMAEARQNGAGDLGGVAMINAMTNVEVLAGKASWSAHRRQVRLNRLRSDMVSGDTRLIEQEADAFLAKHRFQIFRGSPQYRDLCHKLMRADIEQLTRYAERDAGDFTGTPQDPIVVEPNTRLEPLGQAGLGIVALFEKYEKENPNNIRPETFRQSRRDVQHFADFVGPRVHAGQIIRKHVREWKELLAEYPVRATEANAFKGMSPVAIVAANKEFDAPKPTLSRQTVRRYMGSLSGFCAWLVTNDYLDMNPVAGMMPKKGEPTNKRATFTDDALRTLFGSPLFKTAKGDQWRDLDKQGNVAVRDHRYWIPWVMLYSGARPAEVAQLHVADVREQDGIWIMHIRDEGDGNKRTKTTGSRRVVPIHSALVDLGFLDHFERQRTAGEVQVFPEVEIPKEGQIAAQFSREFNRYLTKVGVKTGRDIVAYSLRHTFVDQARLAGFMDDEIAAIVGHETGSSKKTMTSGYGVEQHGTLERRREIVEAVSYLPLAVS